MKTVWTYEDALPDAPPTVEHGYTYDVLFVGVGVYEENVADLVFDYPDVGEYGEWAKVCRALGIKIVYSGGEVLTFKFQQFRKDEDGTIEWCSDPLINAWNLKGAKRYAEFAEKVEGKWEKLQQRSEKNLLRPFGSPVGLKAILITMGAVRVASVYTLRESGYRRKVTVPREAAERHAEKREGEYWVETE